MINQEQRLQELRKYFKPQEKAFIMSSLGYLSVEEVSKLLKRSKQNIEDYISIIGKDQIIERIKQMYAETRLQSWMAGDLPSIRQKKKIGSKKNVIGTREDLGIFVRSKMEANIARILSLKYGRTAWEYEPEVYELKESNGKRKFYMPDFRVTLPDGSKFLIEVKGRFFTGDITKLRKFFKEFPTEKVILITGRYSYKVKEFAEKNKIEAWIYEDLRDDLVAQIPNWE